MNIFGWLFIVALLIMLYAGVVWVVVKLGAIIYDEIKERMDSHK